MADVQWLSARSAELAHEAGRVREHSPAKATELYSQAAELAVAALRATELSKERTRGIIGYSAATLLFKAERYAEAGSLAAELLTAVQDEYAKDQLKVVLSSVWAEEAKRAAGLKFLPGQVVVSISGGQVVVGGAPLETVLKQVKNVQAIFVRVIEFLSELPFQGRAARARVLDELCRPWIFQMPAGSYQFAIAVEERKQLDFFKDGIHPEQITDKFMEVIAATSSGDTESLERLVPDPQYRRSFVAMTRRLAPSDGAYDAIRIYSPTSPRSVQLDRVTKRVTSDYLVAASPARAVAAEGKAIGILRALDLDKDWLIVDTVDGPVRVTNLVDAVDDYIGSLVNRRVVVDFIRERRSLHFIDINPAP